MPSSLAEKRKYDQLWTHRGNKFVIGTIHGESIEIIAQYNPKELARQAAATWETHPNTSAKHSPTGEGNMWSEYKTTAPRTMTLELLFDGYEEGISIAPIVESLERLTIPVDMSSRDATKRRPQLCVAVWGTQQLRCVVQSVATKLTMFDISGEPLRASCTVVLSEVDVAAMMKVDSSTITKISQKGGGYKLAARDHTNPYPPEDSKPTRVPRTSDPTASDTSSAAGNREPKSMQSAPAGASSAKSAPASSPAAAPSNTPAAAPANELAPPASAPAPASADAPASTPPAATGTPSAQINPNALDGDQPGTGDLFVNDPPAPQTGTPSAQIDPNALDGDQPGTGNVFKDESPAPNAVSGPDAGTANPKTKAVYDDLE